MGCETQQTHTNKPRWKLGKGATEHTVIRLILSTYESRRRRGRIDLPIDIDDLPLFANL